MRLNNIDDRFPRKSYFWELLAVPYTSKTSCEQFILALTYALYNVMERNFHAEYGDPDTSINFKTINSVACSQTLFLLQIPLRLSFEKTKRLFLERVQYKRPGG